MIFSSGFHARRNSLRNRKDRTAARSLRATRARRGLVEQLEDRRLLATVSQFDFSDVGGAASDEGFVTSGPANQWHLSTGRGDATGHSPDDSFYFGSGEGPAGGGSYANDADGTLLSPSIDLTLTAVARLSFKHFLNVEPLADLATVSVVHAGGTTVIATSGAEMPNLTVGFETVTLDLTEYVGQSIQLAFRFQSDGSTTAEGWYVDDVVVTTGNAGFWKAQGPFGSTRGQVENNAPSNQVIGAVHAVLAHPTNANILYIGGTNGGVWKTQNATSLRPHWVPLTDDLPSQSIGAMAFDVADPTSNTLYAGVGRFSSFGRIGNDRVGLYKSTDGGQSWTILNDKLVGANISGIVANGNNVVVSVNAADNFGVAFANTGIFRSIDGGSTFTQVSGGDGSLTGLPGGVSYDLVANPNNPNVLYTSAVFSDFVGGVNGVYRSSNGGASWLKVSNPVMDALILSGGGGSPGTSNLELAAGKFDNVYAAIINNGDMKGLFRSDDSGLTWIQMDTPTTNENGIDVGLNPRGIKGPSPAENPSPEELAGGQGAIHFSMVTDPDDPNIVYVAGDRQPRTNGDAGSFPNSIGANDFSGRVFRGDASQPAGSQFVHLTHSNVLGAAGGGTASGSSPHADSRDMTFDANGDLIEGDDGGVYRRTNPRDNTGDWFGIMGNLQITEVHNVAYDSLSNTIMTGNQDTGSTYQSGSGAHQWLSLSTADGGDIAIDNVSLAASNQSIRYTSFQFLGAFRQTVYDAAGNLIDQNFPALAGFNGDGAFVTPVVLNAIDPNRLAIQGGSQTYVSLDQGASVTGLGAAPNSSIDQNAMAYGGRRSGVANADLLWVGSGSDVFVRTNGGAPLSPTPSDPTNQRIRDLTIDPEDWATSFVVDTDSVFVTTDTGSSWTDITGNLLSLASTFYSIVYVGTNTVDALLVGTNAGVFASLASSFGSWVQLGNDLPNALVYDMDYNAADNVLVAGTLGRGAWRLDNVSNLLSVSGGTTSAALDAANNLVLTDQDGNYPDDLRIQSDTANNRFVLTGVQQSIVTSIPGATGSGTGTVTIPFAAVAGPDVIVNTLGGSDSLTVDFALGKFAKQIRYQGGSSTADRGNSLTLVGGSTFDDAVFNFTGQGSGNINLTGNAAITYTHLEPVHSEIQAVDIALNYNDSPGSLTLTPNGFDVNGINVSSAIGESISVVTPTGMLAVNGANTPNNDVVIVGPIDLGGAGIAISGNDVLVDRGVIVSSGLGGIQIDASRTLVLVSGSQLRTEDGDVTLTANQGTVPGAGDFSGILIDDSSIGTVNGDVLLQGRGGASLGGSFNTGISMVNRAKILSTGTGTGAGTITLEGRGGDADNSNFGVQFVSVDTRISSVDGDITVSGIGGTGTGAFNLGVFLLEGIVESTGVGPDAAKINILGIGGVGTDNNSGVLLFGADTQILSQDGDITIDGQGKGTIDFNLGVNLLEGVQVRSTGVGPDAAAITILGTGANARQSNHGIQAVGLPPQISTVDGPLQLIGTGGSATGGFNEGILLLSGLISSTGLGDVALQGIAGGLSGEGIYLDGGTIIEATAQGDIDLSGTRMGASNDIFIGFSAATLGSTTGTGDLTITADSLSVDNATAIQGQGKLTFLPRTSTTSIGVGNGFGTLSINAAEISRIADGFSLITIGDELAGTGLVRVSAAAFSDPVKVAGGGVDLAGLDATGNDVTVFSRLGFTSDSSVDIDVTGSTVTLLGNVAPGQAPGTLTVDGDLLLSDGNFLLFEIGGIAPFITPNHDMMDVTGTVTIGNDVTLLTTRLANFSPAVGNRFVIIHNDGADPINGRFVGLDEGDRINNFLGSGFSAVITYQGGTDNNDVVLTVLPNVTLSASPFTIAEENGVATFTARLSAPLGVPVTVDLSIAGTALLDNDYTLSGTQIVIAPGQTTGSVSVTAMSDSLIEANETVSAEIVSVTNGFLAGIQQASITILDDDFLTPVISSTITGSTAAALVPLNVNFNSEVTGFDQGDLQVVGGVISDFIDAGGGAFTFNVTPSGEGTISVSVPADAAQDSASKGTLASNQFLLIIDRTAPTPVITAPAATANSNPFDVMISFGESVTGFTAADVIVTNGSVTNLFNAGNGNYTATVTAIADGTVTLNIPEDVAADLAGNLNEAAALFSIDLDSVVPAPTITGPASPANFQPIVVTINFGEVVSGFALQDITVENGVVTDFLDNGDGSFTATVDPTADGQVTVNVAANVASDAAANGNLAATQYSVTVDTLAPQPTITGPSSPTTSSTLNVSVAFGEPVVGFTVDDISVGNGAVTSLIDNANGSFSLVIQAAADGEVTVDIAADVAADNAANSSLVAARYSVIVDTTAPTLVVPADLLVEGDTTGGATVTSSDIATFLAAATATDTADPTVTITHDAPAFFPLGTTVVTFTATDDADFTTSATATVVVVDTTAPAITTPANLSLEGDTVGGVLTEDPAITAFLAAGSAVDLVDPSVTVTHDAPTLFPVGDTTVTFTSVDDAGNVGIALAIITITDTTSPTLSVPEDITVEGDTSGGASATGAVVAAFLAATSGTDIVDDSLEFSHDAPDVLPVGVTVVTFAVTDDSGNITSDTASVTVTDSIAPSLILPANVTFEGDTVGGALTTEGEIAAYIAAITATDIVDASVTIVHDAPALLPLGARIVNFTATDDAGNSVSRDVTFTVADSTAPVITGVSDLTLEGDASGGSTLLNADIAALLAAVASSDIVDTTPILSHDAPDLFPVGDTVVTFTATDASGNVSTAAATITVTDTIAPQILLPPSLTVNANIAAGAAATLSVITDFLNAAGATDQVDANPTLTNDAPSIFPVGDTLVSFTAVDDAGNQQTAAVTVTVMALDFGDAPSASDSGFASSYPTTQGEDGARHSVGSLVLGLTIDVDFDGQPSAQADLDTDDGVSVIASSITSSSATTTSSLRVIASSAAKLDAWIDFNRDGDWDDEGEQIFTGLDVMAGSNLLSVTVPAGATAGSTGARFRLSTAGSLLPTGLAADGEVEDYLLEIIAASSTAVVDVEIPTGGSDVAIEGDLVVVRQGATVLFRSPLNSFGQLNLNGSPVDDVLQFSTPVALGNQTLTFDGGPGKDLLQLVGTGQTLDLTQANITLRDVEGIDISGTGSNSLVISIDEVKAASTTSDTLQIVATRDDQISFGTGWKAEKPVFIEGQFTHLVSELAIGGTARVEIRNDRMLRNPLNPFDADRDGSVLPLDALRVINELRRRGSGPITLPTNDSEISNLYFDVSGNNDFTALDALQVINALARIHRGGSAEGESATVLVDLGQFSQSTDSSVAQSDPMPAVPVVETSKPVTVSVFPTDATDELEAIDAFMQAYGDGTTSDADDDELKLLADTL